MYLSTYSESAEMYGHLDAVEQRVGMAIHFFWLYLAYIHFFWPYLAYFWVSLHQLGDFVKLKGDFMTV